MVPPPMHRHQWLRYQLPPPINPDTPSINVIVANGAASNTPSLVLALLAATSYQSTTPRQLMSPLLMVPPPTHRYRWLRYRLPPPINPDTPSTSITTPSIIYLYANIKSDFCLLALYFTAHCINRRKIVHISYIITCIRFSQAYADHQTTHSLMGQMST